MGEVIEKDETVRRVAAQLYGLFGKYTRSRCDALFRMRFQFDDEEIIGEPYLLEAAAKLIVAGVEPEEYMNTIFDGSDGHNKPFFNDVLIVPARVDQNINRVLWRREERGMRERVQAQFKYAVFYTKENNITLEEAVQLDFPFASWFRLLYTENPTRELLLDVKRELRSPALRKELKRNKVDVMRLERAVIDVV